VGTGGDDIHREFREFRADLDAMSITWVESKGTKEGGEILQAREGEKNGLRGGALS